MGFYNFIKNNSFKIYSIWIVVGLLANIAGLYYSENDDCVDIVIPSKQINNDEFVSRNIESQHKQTLLNTSCVKNIDCGSHGDCTDGMCTCYDEYITIDMICGYKQRTQLTAWLLSFFVGGLGVDWFWLARGNACYNCAGSAKLLTCAGVGIWWLVDWIRILTGDFPDGNGHPLYENM